MDLKFSDPEMTDKEPTWFHLFSRDHPELVYVVGPPEWALHRQSLEEAKREERLRTSSITTR